MIPAPSHCGKVKSWTLDTVGDGSGVKDHIVDYTGVEQIIRVKPPVGKVYQIARLLVHYDDNGSISTDKYAAAPALTAGVKCSVKDANDVDLNDLTNGLRVKNNGDWAALCYDLGLQDWGGGDNMFTVRWTFEKHGVPIRINGDDGESFCITLNDDFSTLNQHLFVAEGVELG